MHCFSYISVRCLNMCRISKRPWLKAGLLQNRQKFYSAKQSRCLQTISTFLYFLVLKNVFLFNSLNKCSNTCLWQKVHIQNGSDKRGFSVALCHLAIPFIPSINLKIRQIWKHTCSSHRYILIQNDVINIAATLLLILML